MSSIIPISRLQEDPYAISKKCHSQTEPIFITKDGYGDMVLMSFDDYEALKLKAEQKTAINKLGDQKIDIDYGYTSQSSASTTEAMDSLSPEGQKTKADLEKLPIEDVLKILKNEVERQHSKKGF